MVCGVSSAQMENQEIAPCPWSAFRYDLLFCWLTPTMRRAKGKKVELEDLPQLPKSDTLAEIWSPKRRLAPPDSVRRVARGEFVGMLYAALAMLLYATSMTLMPVAMMMVIKCAEVEETDDFNWLDASWSHPEAMIYWIIIYVVLQSISAVANHWQFHLAYHAGQRMRAQVILMVFQKALKVDPRVRPSVGHTLNLMSTDAQKFLEALPFLHKLWASPLQVVIASIILLALVDVSALCGIAVLVLVVPMSRQLAKLLNRFRAQHLVFQDQRVRMCVEMLEGIRCIKYFAWEKPYLQRVFGLRTHEIYWALRESLVFGFSMIFAVLSPTLAFTATLLAFVLQGSATLTATRVFGTLALLNALRFPIMDLGSMLATIVSLYTSWHRLRKYLLLPEAGVPVQELKDDLVQVQLDHCSFSCTEGGKELFRLKLDTELQVRCGEVVVILGKVGSGKSTLLQGLLGEVNCQGTFLACRGRIAYCSQQAWIRNESMRENILFGEAMDTEWYTTVLEACGLATDLKQLAHGDLTEIGERGITLSGGQKQRVALARAVYNRKCSLLLLDDVFSALDAHTSRHILQALLGPEGLLRDRAVVMASHSTACAERAQKVLLLGTPPGAEEESSLLFEGTWRELCDEKELLQLIGQVETETHHEKEEHAQETLELQKLEVSKPPGLMKAEDHSGSISWRAIRMYLRAAGGWAVVSLFVLSSVLERTLIIGLDWWLSRWTTVTSEATADEVEVSFYLGVYLVVVLFAAFFVALSRLTIAVSTVKAGQRLFEQLAMRVAHAPTRWWDTTPLGRVLNRFSFDTENADTTLVTKLFPAIMSLSWCAGAIAVMVVTFWPWSLLFVPIPTFIYFRLFQFSRKSIRQFQQLDSISRSPMQSVYSEVLNGIVSVRAFACEAQYQERLANVIDVNSGAILTFNSSNRWLGVRVELLAAFISSLLGLGVWLLRGFVPASLVGMCFIWNSNLAVSLGFNCIFSSQAEACFTSIERITEYAVEVPDERLEHPDVARCTAAGTAGASGGRGEEGSALLSFNQVSLRYQPGLPLALNAVSFHLQRQERLAVVGRTGSGKSTLAVALFRLCPLEEGQVLLRGQNLAQLPLDVARRSMGIITQDPVIFSGTVHYNLDPFGEFDAEKCSAALEQAQLAESLELETQIDQVARLESKPVPASLSPTMGGFCRAAFVGEELGRSLQREGVPGEA
ncbi:unnamed protein product [Durusdinium trenchii]|uniref:Uncharacterized protein n=1 Tax=Durusdinium trenchii TaxID=1381693 RepID=A0ABP0PB62_9DINO